MDSFHIIFETSGDFAHADVFLPTAICGKAEITLQAGPGEMQGFSILIYEDFKLGRPTHEIHDQQPGSLAELQARSLAALFTWEASVLHEMNEGATA